MYQDNVKSIKQGATDVTNRKGITDFQEHEVGLRHPLNDAIVRLKDNGVVDVFSEKTIGMKLDPNARSTNLFAPKINVFGTKTNIFTARNNLIWNGWRFNSKLYEMCDYAPLRSASNPRNFKLKCDYIDETGEHVEVLIPPYLKDTSKDAYSPEVKDIAKQLGLII